MKLKSFFPKEEIFSNLKGLKNKESNRKKH
jgi:hypothetical protein